MSVRTAHYDLVAEVDEARAVDYARLLEASYEGFREYFGVAPELAPGSRLEVRFFATQASWAAGLAADGYMVPKEAGGVFEPGSRRAYLYEQGNPYYDQVLLLHEAAHQFHLLGRAAGRSLPFWYVEGVAEHISRHDWDGACVTLGRVPLLNWDDMPERALEESMANGIDVAAVVHGGGTPTRAASWAVVRFLEEGEGRAHREAFRDFREAFDLGMPGAEASFDAALGAAADLTVSLAGWLPTSQQPMKPIFLEWIHRTPSSVQAITPGAFSLAILKEGPTHLEATYDAPAGNGWRVGAVLAYQDAKNYQAIVVDAEGVLRSFTANNGSVAWGVVGSAPALLDGEHGEFAVDLLGASLVRLTVNGVASDHTVPFPARPGLALNDASVLFRETSWH